MAADTAGVTVEHDDGVAVVTFANPPVNGLGHAVRTALLEALDRANADETIQGIVITGAGKNFSAGADIREFNTPKALAEPTLNTLIRALDESRKPVVAAVGGTCMGGGLELAMGCHHRVAIATTAIALPEVKLGLMPGAGGTQRLPRAIGVEAALDMIVTGASRQARELEGTKLFDRVVAHDVVAAAKGQLREVAGTPRACKRLRDLPAGHPQAEAFFQFARNSVRNVAPNLPAPFACVDAVAGAVALPFDEGMRNERRLFLQLMSTPESRALRHAFFAERAAQRIEDIDASTRPRSVERVGVVGAGTMGRGIALAFLGGEMPVVLTDTNADALDKAAASIRESIEASAAKGRIPADVASRRVALLSTSADLDTLRACDLIIEAVYEAIDVKREVFAALDGVAKHGAILATNTSTLDVDAIAAATHRPADVVGMHFFSPAHVMKLVEIVRAEATAPDVLVTALATTRRIGKISVVARVCDGFIGNRMIEPYLRQAMFLVEEGASPAQVDAALERFGMAMGPFRVSDLAGLDIGWQIRKRRYVEHPDVRYSRIADRLCELGRFGQKTGAGWYRYDRGRRDALPDPVVADLIAEHRAALSITSRTIGDDEIVDRCILALVNEGARVLEQGIAQRASDIDLVYLTGYGFPRYRGGPMLHADQVGLFNVVRRMQRFAAMPGADVSFWTPAPLLARLAADNATFNR